MPSQVLPAQAKDLFQYLFEQASLGIAVEDLDGTLLLAKPRAVEGSAGRDHTAPQLQISLWLYAYS